MLVRVLFKRLDQDDVERLRLDVLGDLLGRVVPRTEARNEDIRAAPEDDHAVAGEEVREVALEDAVDGFELLDPPVDVDHERIAATVLLDDVGAHRIRQADDTVPPPLKFGRDGRLSRSRRTGDADHHMLLIASRNNSFSQSSPILTLI